MLVEVVVEDPGELPLHIGAAGLGSEAEKAFLFSEGEDGSRETWSYLDI